MEYKGGERRGEERGGGRRGEVGKNENILIAINLQRNTLLIYHHMIVVLYILRVIVFDNFPELYRPTFCCEELITQTVTMPTTH